MIKYLYTILYILASRLKDRLGERREATSGEKLFAISRDLGCSEFDIFCEAADRWNLALDRIPQDFKRYLWFSELPFYVTDWLRNNKFELEDPIFLY